MNSAGGANPLHILIVKLSAIGDVIQTFPMVKALKERYPGARIDWLVEEDASGILHGHPALDRVIISRRKSWLRGLRRRGNFRQTLREIGRFLREVRSRQYDMVIDNHGILKSGLLVMLARGRRKIGFRPSAGIAEEGNYLFTNERYRPLSIERHALDRYLDLVFQMGVPIDGANLEFPLPEESRERAEALLRKNGFFSRPIVVIHPMAKWETKQWPLDKFAGLISALVEKETSVVVTGSPQDVEPVTEILNRAGHSRKVLNLAGRTSLKELAGIFSLADLVVTPDTGPMHLAAAVRAPLIALFGPTAPWRTGPYGNHNRVIRKNLACSPCFQKKCDRPECMTSITVEEVLSAAEKKLKQKSNGTQMDTDEHR